MAVALRRRPASLARRVSWLARFVRSESGADDVTICTPLLVSCSGDRGGSSHVNGTVRSGMVNLHG